LRITERLEETILRPRKRALFFAIVTGSLVFRNSFYVSRRHRGLRFGEASLWSLGVSLRPSPLETSARRAARNTFLIAGALAEQSAPYVRKYWKKV